MNPPFASIQEEAFHVTEEEAAAFRADMKRLVTEQTIKTIVKHMTKSAPLFTKPKCKKLTPSFNPKKIPAHSSKDVRDAADAFWRRKTKTERV